MLDESLYTILDHQESDAGVVETFRTSAAAQSTWGPIQHGGPVAALLTRAMDRSTQRTDSRLTRIVVDLLGPVPMSNVRVQSQIVRPGKKIELISSTLEAEASDGSWRPYAQGTAWRQATQPTHDVVNHASPVRTEPADLDELPTTFFPKDWGMTGFVDAVDVRVEKRSETEGKASLVWLKLKHQLVSGEEVSALEQFMALSDVTNGVGARLNPMEFRFLNTELTVHLYRAPSHGWLGLEAETSVGSDGVGMAASVAHMGNQPIGRVTQSLLVERV